MFHRSARHCYLLALFIGLTALSTQAASARTQQLLAGLPRTEFVIRTPDARQHRFRIWIATTSAQRAQGLMFIRELPADAGMLFLYDRPQRLSMWMKNTYIPLDMLFIRDDGKIVQIENAVPHSLETISSREEVVAVLELNGGTAARLKISPGAIADLAPVRPSP